MTAVSPSSPRQSIELSYVNMCSICRDSKDINATDSHLAKIKPCDHTYHENCITDWNKARRANSKKCPECREPITSVSRLKQIGTTANEQEPEIEETPIRQYIRPGDESTEPLSDSVEVIYLEPPRSQPAPARNPLVSHAIAAGALYGILRPFVTGLNVGIGTAVLSKTPFKSDLLLNGLQGGCGTMLTLAPNLLLFGLSDYASTTMSHLPACKHLKSIHTLAQVGVEAANSVLGNRIVNFVDNSSVETAAMTGAVGCATVLGTAACVLGASMAISKANQLIQNRNQ